MAAGLPGTVVSADNAGTLLVWEARTGDVLHRLESPPANHYTLASDPAKGILAGAFGESIVLWDLHSGKEVRRLRGHKGGTHSLAFHPGGDILCGANPCDAVLIWNWRKGEIVGRIPCEVPGDGPAFSPDGRILALIVDGLTVRLWDWEKREQLRILRVPQRGMVAHHRGLGHLVFSPDGSRVAACSDDGLVHLWDPYRGDHIMLLRLDSSAFLREVAFVRNGQALVGVNGYSQVKVWNALVDPNVMYGAEAERLVDRLFQEQVVRSAVVARLEADTELSPAFRSVCLHVVAERNPDPADIIFRAKALLCASDRSPEEYQQALRTAEAIMAALPEKASSLALLGKAQYRTGQLEKALKTLTQAQALASPDSNAEERAVGQLFLALTYRRLGKWEEARKQYIRARDIAATLMEDPDKHLLLKFVLEEAESGFGF